MANFVLIIGIVLLLAGAALVITGSSQVGQQLAWNHAVQHNNMLYGPTHTTPINILDWLPIAMPLVPGILLIAWASRLKHKARSRDERN